MSRKSLSWDEFERYDEAMNATIRRISAENTWLRHSLMEMKSHVADLHGELDALAKRLRLLKKELATSSPKPSRKTRSQQ